MAYAPRNRKYKVRWNIAVPLLLLVVLIIYALVNVLFPAPKEEVKKLTVCDLDGEKTVELLNKKIAETYTVKDYLYYGESLAIYENTYKAGGKDALAGKTVELHNLCSDETVSLTLDSTVDQKITTEDLDPGFYEVTVTDNLVKKRIVFQDTVNAEPFYTAKRKGNINKITLIADKDLLKDYGIHWDQNYMFLNVEKNKPKDGDIDVLIDPYGMNTDLTMVPDEGNTGHGLVEYKEMYDAAVQMKKELEGYGLRVELTKSSAKQTPASIYGDDGRLAVGYQKNAKYYLTLRFNTWDADDSIAGVEMWYSSYAGPNLANKILYGLEKNLNMKGSPYTSGTTMGIRECGRTDDGFDNLPNLRESGGRATMAGKISDTAKTENKAFADANGMNALEIDFAYISNADDAANWKKNKEKIVKQTAASFAEAIKASK